jgi:hypothetical protein
MTKLAVAATLFFLATGSASIAQVSIYGKDPKFVDVLTQVDAHHPNIDCTVNHNGPRKWTSGYKFATPEIRVKFALAYQEFLRQHGETGEANDSYRLVSYTDRQAWAMHWWAKEDLNFAPTSSLDEKANWVHDALVDAGNSIHRAGQGIHPLGGDIVTKDNVELESVFNRQDEPHSKPPGNK